MSIKENLEEKKRRNNREKIHFLDKFWDVKQNTVQEKMSEKGIQYKKVIKNLVSALSNEDTEKKEKCTISMIQVGIYITGVREKMLSNYKKS